MADHVHPVLKSERWRLMAALAAIYLIWGSTYLGIRFAIETLPPFLMAGTRNLIAGGLLYAWTARKGVPRPQKIHWRSAVVIGALLIVGGNGFVSWAEERVPSGLAALMIGATPLWIALLNWLVFGSTRPNGRMALGLITGLTGIAILIGPSEVLGGGGINAVGAVALVLSSLTWAAGSLYSRKAPLPSSPLRAASMEMLCGGGLLYLLGTAAGQWAEVHPEHVSLKSVAAVLYLALFGSLIAFSTYGWLLRHTTPARATSYAYVNPVVAVFLGWALAGEKLSPRTGLAAAIIVGSVVLITSVRAQQGSRPSQQVVELPARPDAQPSEAGAGK